MVYVSTRAGKRHNKSEDAVLVGKTVLSEVSEILPVPDAGFVCVADGVGGNLGGAEASHFVLNAMSEWTENTHEDLKSFLQNINNELIATASKNEKNYNMATTLTGILIDNGFYKLVHVGNTRAYIKQGKYLKQVTSDHTTYNWLMSNGQIEAAKCCNKNEITNCFGGNDLSLLSKLFVANCQQFSLALLTSDGIHEYVDLESLEEIISGEGSYADKCEEILLKAIKSGSEDDLSVVIICPLEG